MLSLNKHPQRLHNHTCDQKASLIISMGPLGFRGFRNRGRTATFIMSIPGYLSWAADALVCVQSSPVQSSPVSGNAVFQPSYRYGNPAYRYVHRARLQTQR